MGLEKQLIDIERRLWSNDAAFYKANLIDDALLVALLTYRVAARVGNTNRSEGGTRKQRLR